DDSHAPHVFIFLKANFSFKKICNMSSPGKYPSFIARNIGVFNPICSPSFHPLVLVLAQYNVFAIGVLLDLYTFHRFIGNSFYPHPLGFYGGLNKPPTYTLRLIILDNVYILCFTTTFGTKLTDVYSSNIVLFEEFGPCFIPSVVDHPFKLAIDRTLVNHYLTN
ncbi:hypothetical protein BDL97_05G083700, partial [Sphagnum fallax]